MRAASEPTGRLALATDCHVNLTNSSTEAYADYIVAARWWLGSAVDMGPEIPSVRPDAAISVDVLWALYETVAAQGTMLEPSQWLGERPENDSPQAHVPMSQFYLLSEQALNATSDQALGLHWGERNGGQLITLLPQLIRHAETLRQAFTNLFRFRRLVCDEPGLRLCEHDDHVTLYCSKFSGASLPVRRLLSEMSVLGVYRVALAYDPDARPEQVCFDYPAPPYHEEYTRLFNGCESFDEGFTGIIFKRELLEARIPWRDPSVHEAMYALAERRLHQLTGTATYASRVRDLLMAQPAPHRLTMQAAAGELRLSVRSLHRRLADEGTSYTRLASEASAAVAKRLILDERQSIKEAAYSMGFSDPNSFHRAFKRWTGTTPKALR